MTYKLVQGYWGMVSGDGFKLISTETISEHDTREEAWDALFDAVRNQPTQCFEFLVEKPNMSNGIDGYPTIFDDAPNTDEYRNFMREIMS